MLIVCKTCASSYHIPREILGENGCRLRCVGCGEAWEVTPEAIETGGAPIVEGQRVASEAPEVTRGGLHFRPQDFSSQAQVAWRGQDTPTRKLRGVFSSIPNIKGAAGGLAALLILGCAMGALAARAAIVKAAPNTARVFAAIGLPVNLRGLALDNVRTNIFDSGDRKVLIVEGAVVNLRDSSMEAPNMRIALRGVDKRELYVWTAPAPKAQLGPNEQVAFRTRLAAPPDGVSDVFVRFAAVGDKLSPMKEGL
ncbi:MJ0042-type zinc finger domain-containing protein [Methylocapsa sp. S129]|uniref:MJ0042-type zinc finger domain-containing protein n=1 Tax=Methylocapsa sp. S129 TaxID=1641869 RepID=UPI00131B57D6|nr:zinc-ribbon domain-containing protein [Methylocapsa sp. S129]